MKAAIVGIAIFAMASAGALRSLDMESIIEKVNSAQTTWKAGHNFDPDTPLHLIRKLMGSKKLTANSSLKKKLFSGVELPEEFDARTQWPGCPTIAHVLDQGTCGSCWAVAGAAAFSDRVCIASNGTFTMPLSAENLLACCEDCGNGCDGGFPSFAWQYFVDEGLVTGGDYSSQVGCQPYSFEACEHHTTGVRRRCVDLPEPDTPTCHKKCYNTEYDKSFQSDVHKAQNTYLFSDVESIQEDIMNHGSVEAGFTVYADFLTYKSGVYQHVSGESLGGHAVRVIGWGTEDGTPYWLVANSWNSDWGDGGHFKILRGSNEADFESEMVAGTV